MPSSSSQTAKAMIVESVLTGSRSPEEVLESLNKLDIESYITEKGDLMIKYWQVGAENFVPAERVAEFRARTAEPRGAESLEWVSKHLSELQASYGDKWIAVAEDQVIASADDLSQLVEALDELNVDNPFVTQIPAGPIVWHTLYTLYGKQGV